MILIRRPWTRQPELPDWTALSKRAARLIHTGRGYVANGKGQPLVSAVVSATLPLEDGAFLVGRNEAGQIRCGRWTLVDNQPSSLTAFCLVFSARYRVSHTQRASVVVRVSVKKNRALQ